MSRCFVYLLLASSLLMTSTAFDWNVLNPFHWIIKWLTPEEMTTNSTVKYSVNETTPSSTANLTTEIPGKKITINNRAKPISFNNGTRIPVGIGNKTQKGTHPSTMTTAGTLVNISELATQQANTDIFGIPRDTLKVYNTTKDKSRIPFSITSKNITDNTMAKSTNISKKKDIVQPPGGKNINMSLNHPGSKTNDSLITPSKTQINGSKPSESPVSPPAANVNSSNNDHQDILNDSPRPASNDSLPKLPWLPIHNNKELLNQKVNDKNVAAKASPQDSQNATKNMPKSPSKIMDNLNKKPSATQSPENSQKLNKNTPESPPGITDNLNKNPTAEQVPEDSQKITENTPEIMDNLNKNPTALPTSKDGQKLTENAPNLPSKIKNSLPESETKQNTIDTPKNSYETPQVLEKRNHKPKLATAYENSNTKN